MEANLVRDGFIGPDIQTANSPVGKLLLLTNSLHELVTLMTKNECHAEIYANALDIIDEIVYIQQVDEKSIKNYRAINTRDAGGFRMGKFILRV